MHQHGGLENFTSFMPLASTTKRQDQRIQSSRFDHKDHRLLLELFVWGMVPNSHHPLTGWQSVSNALRQ